MRSNYWGGGAHNALLLVGDFFQHILDARLIDGAARFPYERRGESFWDPLIDAAKEWLGDLFKDWPLGDRIDPRRRFDDPQEQERLEGQAEKDRLIEQLRQKREQYERDQREQETYRE
jgi:penicillin-binding protein 1A